MEVKDNLSQDNFNVQAIEWRHQQLGELIELISGQHILASDYNTNAIGIPYLTGPADFINGKVNISKWTTNSKSTANQADILMTVKGSGAGKVFLLDDVETVAISRQLMAIRPKLCFGKYIFYILNSNEQNLSKNAEGNLIPGLSRHDVNSIWVPVPGITEQRAIATALSDVDALIAALDRLIAKKKAIKQGAMQELLKPKEGWVVKILGESSEISRGGSPRPIEDFLTTQSHGINWIKIGDVGKGAKYIESTEEKIIPEGISRSRYVKEGDFILSNSMSFGRPYILKISGCIHDGWLVIQNYQENFDSDFLYYVLGSDLVLNQYKAMASGSSVLNLNKEIVKKVKINCPKEKAEQTRIAQILTDMDAEIAALERQRDKYKAVKAGMMQELLTGKTRLI